MSCKKIDKILELLEDNSKDCKKMSKDCKKMSKDCKKMSSHIDFIDNVYENIRMPMNYICNSINNSINNKLIDKK